MSDPSQRVTVAKPRIEGLNPLVTVEVFSDIAINDERFQNIISTVDLVCAIDLDRDSLVRPSYKLPLFSSTLCLSRFESTPFVGNIRNHFMPAVYTALLDLSFVIF